MGSLVANFIAPTCDQAIDLMILSSFPPDITPFARVESQTTLVDGKMHLFGGFVTTSGMPLAF